ncbi:three-Cys-motif partner protein TcmP [uncultured Ruminococcus sp.]|uniref:three-Cys-motif partner protein TcmP n=1 Tax=uncultured Ruminococcus sp. TaxID=165186 RepID=UPI002670F44B|nr:three-Cys-motif partner protein TcmP [uncultured Ruminococcus sp.]
MSKKNDDFFIDKKPWSEVKDQLLGCYFKPYVSKILHTYKPLVYVDCFAGKGKFDDGNPGSPLIALNIVNECLDTTTMVDAQISMTFIDLNYADELKENLKDYPWVTVISGKYEDNIKEILKDKRGSNVFLYIDPYGIKALQCSMFDSFANSNFNSIEMLINMNSFGFIREVCNALETSLSLDDPTIFEDLVEYDTTKMTASDKSIQDLNEIAGGDYWRDIIEDYKAGLIDGYQAEEYFAEQYCQRLMNSFTYVLNMPLRIRRGQRPKYRMIHATNHPEGCLLMVDNICNRWEAWQNVQSGGQMSLFQEDPNNHIINESDIESKAIDHFSQCESWTSLNEAMSIFFMKYGPICKTRVIRDLLKKFEKDGRLLVSRYPKVTDKGRPTKFMEENSKKKVSLRWSL